MEAIQDGFINIGDGKIYYEMAGSGEVIVLCHAGFVDSGMWDSQWEALTQAYQVIRFDMRGYGKSSLIDAPVSRREDLRAVLDALKIDQAYLVGCSMGGEIILDFALEHPERVKGLVLVSATPGGFELQGDPPPFLMEMMQAVQTGDVKRVSELQIRIWIDGMYRQPEQVNATVRGHAAEMNLIPVANATFFYEESNPLTPPAMTRLGEIRIPVLVIAGALDHPEILRAVEVMETEIQGTQKAILKHSAHMPNMEQSDEFNALLLDFLHRNDG